MGFEKLMGIAATVALVAAMTGQLPRLITGVRVAQLELIKASQASNWSKAPLLPVGR
jgi:hypothetical protein